MNAFTKSQILELQSLLLNYLDSYTFVARDEYDSLIFQQKKNPKSYIHIGIYHRSNSYMVFLDTSMSSTGLYRCFQSFTNVKAFLDLRLSNILHNCNF